MFKVISDRFLMIFHHFSSFFMDFGVLRPQNPWKMMKNHQKSIKNRSKHPKNHFKHNFWPFVVICDDFWAVWSGHSAIFHDFSFFASLIARIPIKVVFLGHIERVSLLMEAVTARWKPKNSKNGQNLKNTPYIPPESSLGVGGGHMWVLDPLKKKYLRFLTCPPWGAINGSQRFSRY